jgi:hypothetical protein
MKKHKKYEEYTMSNVKKTKNTHAIFFNTVDAVDRKKEEEFLLNYELLDKDYEQDDTVRYYFNSLGYRSDEFTKDHDGEHILFSGCSETEGQGGNLESLWSYMVYKKLSETKKISGFFNLSRGGWGHDLIIANIIQYINTYGKPNKIYVLFPNLSRDFVWQGLRDEEEFYDHRAQSPYYFLKTVTFADGTVKPKQSLKEQREQIIKFINLVKLFEEYCISNNIELIWSTYSIPDGENYKNLNVFKNFIQMSDAYEILSKYKDLIDDEVHNRKNLLWKRDGHSGYLHHYWWSQRFLGLIDTDNV